MFSSETTIIIPYGCTFTDLGYEFTVDKICVKLFILLISLIFNLFSLIPIEVKINEIVSHIMITLDETGQGAHMEYGSQYLYKEKLLQFKRDRERERGGGDNRQTLGNVKTP